MIICLLVPAFILCGAALSDVARALPRQSDAYQPPQQCIINRRKIMEEAGKYYKAEYKTKLLLYKIRSHRQELLVKRLRRLNLLQRMRLKHSARIMRRFIRFQRQVNKANMAYRRKLGSFMKRYQRKVMRQLRMKSLSNRRVVHTRRAVDAKILSDFPRRSPTRKLPRLNYYGSSPVSNLRLRSKKTVEDRIARFTVWRQRILRGFERELNFRLRRDRFQQLRNRLKQRIARLAVRRRNLARRITAQKLKRRKLRRKLQLLQHRGPLIRRGRQVPMDGTHASKTSRVKLRHFGKRISKLTRDLVSLKKRHHGLGRRIRRTAARRKHAGHRMQTLRLRRREQIQETKRLFTRAIEHLTRWKATKPEIYSHALTSNNWKLAELIRTGKMPSVAKPLTRKIVENIINRTRQYHRADGQFFRKILENERMLSRIKHEISKQEGRNAKLDKKLLKLKLRIKRKSTAHRQRNVKQVYKLRQQINYLQTRLARQAKRGKQLTAEAAVLQSRIDSLHNEFAKNFRMWTWNLMKVGLQDYFQVLQSSSVAAKKVRKRKTKRQLRRAMSKRQVVKQKKLLNKLSMIAGVSKRQLEHIIRRKEIHREWSQRKRFARRVVKRVQSIDRKLKRTTMNAAIVARHKLHIRRLRYELRRRDFRIRARRYRLRRRIQAVKMRRKRLIGRVRRLKAKKFAFRRLIFRTSTDGIASRKMTKRLERIDTRINRYIRKIAVYKSRIATLKRRRFQLKIRIRRHRNGRKRLGHRMKAVKQRIKRIMQRQGMLAAKKRRFLRRVVKRNLVSRRVIRKITRRSRQETGHYSRGHNLRMALTSNPEDHKSQRFLARQEAKMNLSEAASKRISFGATKRSGRRPVLPVSLTLRRNKPVDENMKKFVDLQGRFARDVRRTLNFHLRKNRFQLRRRMLLKRIHDLKVRKLVLKNRIAAKIRKNQRLIKELKAMNSKDSIRPAASVSRSILKSSWATIHRISSCTKQVRKMQIRLFRLNRRISRTVARWQRIGRRINVLKQRMDRQLREARGLLFDSNKFLTRWKAIDPKLIRRIGEENNLKYAIAKKRSELKRTSVLKTITRSKIKKIVDGMRRGHRSDALIIRKNIILQRQLSRINRSISKVTQQIANYSKMVQASARKLKNTRAQQKKEASHMIFKIMSKLQKSRKAVKGKTRKLRLLQNRASKLQSEISRLKKLIELSFRTWTWNLIQIVPDFVLDFPDAAKAGTKAKKEMDERNRRRRRREKRLEKKRKLIKKLSLTTGVSKQRLRSIINRAEIPRQRDRLKRFAKRVVKRVQVIQRKLTHTVKKAATVARHKLHIRRLRVRLKRRIIRYQARRQRLKRRIREVQLRRKRLVGQVTQLTARKLDIQRQLIGGYRNSQVQMKIKNTAAAIEGRIKHIVRKVAALQSSVIALNERRVLLRARIHRLKHRRRRYDRRMAAVKRRINRQVRRLKMLAEKKRRFVKRVVTKKLVSRRVIRRVAKPTNQVMRRHFGVRNYRKLVKEISTLHPKLHQFRDRFKRIRKTEPHATASRSRHSPGVRSSVAYLSLTRRQLAQEKAEVTRLLKAPILTREFASRLSRADVSRSEVSKVLGSNKLLKVTKVEFAAKRTLQSAKPVPVQRLVALQSRLRHELQSLKRKIASQYPAFNKMVQRTMAEYASEDEKMRTGLKSRISETKEALSDIINKQKWLYRTEYQTLISQEQTPDVIVSPATATSIEYSESQVLP